MKSMKPPGLQILLMFEIAFFQSLMCSNTQVESTISNLSSPTRSASSSAVETISTPGPSITSTPRYSPGFNTSAIYRRLPFTSWEPTSITLFPATSISPKTLAPHLIQSITHITNPPAQPVILFTPCFFYRYAQKFSAETKELKEFEHIGYDIFLRGL